MEFREDRNQVQIFKHGWQLSALDFIQVDADKNEYWLKVKDYEQIKRTPGVIGFDILAIVNIHRNLGGLTIERKLFAVIIYKGGHNISVKIVEHKNGQKTFRQEQAKYKKDNPS